MRYLRKTSEDVEAIRFSDNPEEVWRWCRQHLDANRLTLEGGRISVSTNNDTVTVMDGEWLVLDRTNDRLSCWTHHRFLAHFSALSDHKEVQIEMDTADNWALVPTPPGGIGGSGPDVTTLKTFNQLVLDHAVYPKELEEQVVAGVLARVKSHDEHGPLRRAENAAERLRALGYLYQELLDAVAYDEVVGFDYRPRRVALRGLAVDILRQLRVKDR